MAVLFIFIDGIGVGENNSANPLANSQLKSFSYFTNSNGFHKECEEVENKNLLYKAIDANLNVKGLPQSGTGQVTLFTGINAAKFIGKHFGPYPYSKTKPLLEEESLFKKVINLNKKPHFLNAYPDIFFKKSEKIDRWTSTTLMARSAGIKLNKLKDIQSGKGITAEIIQSAWRDMLGLDVPEISPEEAAERALKSLDNYDMVLYEYYLTDKAGHKQKRENADLVLHTLDRFLIKIIQDINEDDTIVITSDHGNLEDLSVKTHTRNLVPLFVKGDTDPFKDVTSIEDITPAIIEVLREMQ
jgi:2,3-bisphosphoglycerate-independent phosphoglycerate mutase